MSPNPKNPQTNNPHTLKTHSYVHPAELAISSSATNRLRGLEEQHPLQLNL